MKTYSEILDEIFNKGGIPLSEVYESAAKEYARQCCEDLRSRCSNNALAEEDYYGGDPYVSIASITETEIILP